MHLADPSEDKEMNDESSNQPDWIKKSNREREEKKRQEDEDSQRQIKRALLVEQKGPDFWKRLLDRLADNVKALEKLEGEDLNGSMSSGSPAGELDCQIHVNRSSVRFGPELSHMSLFYRPGGSRIRRWYQDQPIEDISLVEVNNEVLARAGNNTPMTAEQLADYIVESMAEKVKAR
jgi:hypothetical protein